MFSVWTCPEARVHASIQGLRPGWLEREPRWRNQLEVLRDHDIHWIERQWDLASGPGPSLDESWVTTEEIR